jgi:hypothetical protein
MRTWTITNHVDQTGGATDQTNDLIPTPLMYSAIGDAPWVTSATHSVGAISRMDIDPMFGTDFNAVNISAKDKVQVRISPGSLPMGESLRLLKVIAQTPIDGGSPFYDTSVVELSQADTHILEAPLVDQMEASAVLQNISIVPTEGMVDVIGDVVKSIIPGSYVKHFVTPKKTAELPQDYVILNAVGVTASDISPGVHQVVTWGPEGEAVPNEPLKRRVKRDTIGRTKVQLITTQNGAIVAQTSVWVVWAPVTLASKSADVFLIDEVLSGTRATKTASFWDFEATIQPASIIVKTDEIPDLTGPPLIPEKPPESTIGNHAIDNLGFVDPKSKWDISRCWRAKTIATTVTAADCLFPDGSIIGGDYPTPVAGKIHATTPNPAADHFPMNLLEGNDYTSREQKPYDDTLGKLVDDDAPGTFVKTSAGAVGNTLEVRYQFGAFTRLQIGKKWYRISDRKAWRYHGKLKKVNEQTVNVDHNNDGDKLDKVWINNSTISDATNAGF